MPDTPGRTHRDLKEELLELLAGQVGHTPVPVSLSMALVAYMAAQYVSAWYWGSWLAAVFLMQGVRWFVLGRLPRMRHLAVYTRMNIALGINTANTVLHSLSLLWFPLFSPYEGAIQSMLFVGMGVAAIVTMVGYLPFTLTHILVTLLPLFSLWAYRGIWGDGGSATTVMALLGFGYAASLFRISRRIFDMYRDSFLIRIQLAQALAQAEAAGRAKTRFLASASHDLRQPIHTLSLFSAALGMRNTDARTHDIIENMDAAVQALAYQLDALLDISKLDAGIVDVRPTNFNIHTLLQRLREEFLPLAADRSITLGLDCPEEAVVYTDSALLERIVRNLLTNAVNHNSGCRLDLRLYKYGGGWRLLVADTGTGIPPAEQERIFEEFYQLENPERDRSKGLGLGLAIVRRLSSLLQLDMEFESRPGLGTRFGFNLRPENTLVAEQPALRVGDELLQGLRVLVVDDESAVRKGMRVLLESFGCLVSTADSSDAAISSATTDKPDIALVDLRLRSHDSGLIAIDRLRHIYPNLPAIIISGDTAPDRLLEASRAGIPVLSKPVLIEPLKEAIVTSCHIENDSSRVRSGRE